VPEIAASSGRPVAPRNAVSMAPGTAPPLAHQADVVDQQIDRAVTDGGHDLFGARRIGQVGQHEC
jgi:hypothetical protein